MDKQRERRTEIAQETLRILREGRYTVSGTTVDLLRDISESNKRSVFIPQDEAIQIGENFTPQIGSPLIELRDESTLAAILRVRGEETNPFGVLNFASAKNPGGGFLNGALAHEESLAIASSLYDSQIKHPAYYETNRACKSMVYTDCAIWSPDVVFFRDDGGNLLPHVAKASVLTLPAVNYGQVILKNEDKSAAREAMKRRMKIALAIFAKQGCEVIILGAYGCGVFRNDPADVAAWWDELLREYGGHFRRIIFAILDRFKTGGAFSAFRYVFRKTADEIIKIHNHNLNIHYSAPNEVWDKLREVYVAMPHWKGFANGIPQWYGQENDGKLIEASVEPGGLHFFANMPQGEWDSWFALFKSKASKALGYAVGEPEDCFRFPVYDKKG